LGRTSTKEIGVSLAAPIRDVRRGRRGDQHRRAGHPPARCRRRHAGALVGRAGRGGSRRHGGWTPADGHANPGHLPAPGPDPAPQGA
jgi:hypothetical protein